MSSGSTPLASVSLTPDPATATVLAVCPASVLPSRVTVTVNWPAAGVNASSSGSEKVSASTRPRTSAPVSVGAAVSGVTLTSFHFALMSKRSGALPARSRTGTPAPGGAQASVASCVPSGIAASVVRRIFVLSVPSTATAVTAGRTLPP